MKVIISHDVDHLSAWEHWHDWILPKFIARTSLQLLAQVISLKQWASGIKSVLTNQWNNLEALMTFDLEQNIPATFFVGVSNGLGLSYSLQSAQQWVRYIQERGFDVGVHGIAYADAITIQREWQTFRIISGRDDFGIRMHYLRQNEQTLPLLQSVGYLFDATPAELSGVRKIGAMYVFPLHLMDVRILYRGITEKVTLSEAMAKTKANIQLAADLRLPYLTVLFHDIYFCASYPLWLDWYQWLIEYLKSNDMSFCNYQEAIYELQEQTGGALA